MIRLTRATAVCYRFYDIAESIDLARASALLAQGSSRLKLTREGSEYVQLSNPPLAVDLGTRPLHLLAGKLEVQVAARLYDHGAASIIVRVPIPVGISLEDLVPFADELYDSAEVDRLSGELTEQLRTALAPAIKDSHLWSQSESYTVLMVKELEGADTATDVLKDPAMPRLLLGEVREGRLSSQEARDVTERSFSYTDHDLVIIDWNAAFLWEPSGSSDIADLLEIANEQLLELRYYDDVLDRELTRIYDEIEARKKRGPAIFRSPWKDLMRELMLLVIELSELLERVENSIKIVGDVYLARVYEAALTQLRVSAWQQAVTRKQRLLTQTYELLKGETDTARSLTLEVMVVLLILFEVTMALSRALPH